jgi:hypothetical protein
MLSLLTLDHPDVPSDGASVVIGERVASELESELDLAVMITLVPDHVLQEENGVVVVDFHVLPGEDFPLNCVANGLSTAIQHLRDAAAIAFVSPLLVG